MNFIDLKNTETAKNDVKIRNSTVTSSPSNFNHVESKCVFTSSIMTAITPTKIVKWVNFLNLFPKNNFVILKFLILMCVNFV